MDHEFPIGIFHLEKQDYLFRCSVAPGNFPLGRPKKSCSIYSRTGFPGKFLQMVNNRLRPGLLLVLGVFQCYRSYRFEAKKGGGSLRIGRCCIQLCILRQLSENTCLVYIHQRVDLAIFHNFCPQLTFDLIINNNNNNSNNNNINNNFNHKTVKNWRK